MKTISEIKWGLNVNDPKVDALDVRVFIDTALIKLQDNPKQFIRNEVALHLESFLAVDSKTQEIQKEAEEA